MPVRGIAFQIAWRIDDSNGQPVLNTVENLDPGLNLPPLPRVGDRVEFSIGERSFFAEILQSSLGYQIDDVINITAVSHIRAREV